MPMWATALRPYAAQIFNGQLLRLSFSHYMLGSYSLAFALQKGGQDSSEYDIDLQAYL